MKNLPLLIGTILGTMILIVGISFLFSNKLTKDAQPVVVDQAQLMAGATHVRGAEGATVTVVEFADLQCPACRATQPLIDELLNRYPDKLKVVFRHFPLTSIHPLAQTASQAVEAAHDQGKFWELHDLLYDRQLEWTDLSEADFKAKLGEYAQELQLDKTTFLEKMESQEIKDRINVDATLAGQIKVDSTPTFYVNGQETSAQQLLPTVESLVSGT